MKRLMIIPAAGAGSRLRSTTPKALYPILGRPMIAWVLERYDPYMDRFIIVVSPSNAGAMDACRGMTGLPVDFVTQPAPTGMLDAILLAHDLVRQALPDEVWVTWCDQVAVSRATVERVAGAAAAGRHAMVMPTVMAPDPYIHWVRDGNGRITAVRQRRELDEMPAIGEADIGLFCLSRTAYLELLPRFAGQAAPGGATQERNFLPFVPWLESTGARDRTVLTVPAASPNDALGVNDPADVVRVEQVLRHA